ncbi:hypothetical protein H8356DRAFT_1744836 [Neocallimastix lanati (nom. inval.)]|uniref:Uncharacterized protein n=1 Tax=Neocallimastix californiae TaxID=1754190 RepID=A0A1Y2AKF6_9FUNG|nr:hypothetical protein H8356DRAFT_1744836 [Neocallimastix sp. JGI-2020a]ORY22717.1 hypothetical protein LY90DRAFT_675758 [Neocallimastix californiae]|eukprot:ORY22717.1 hypothetical protein LY90DRAFT_675758 [Neocallimastix californiae]
MSSIKLSSKKRSNKEKISSINLPIGSSISITPGIPTSLSSINLNNVTRRISQKFSSSPSSNFFKTSEIINNEMSYARIWKSIQAAIRILFEDKQLKNPIEEINDEVEHLIQDPNFVEEVFVRNVSDSLIIGMNTISNRINSMDSNDEIIACVVDQWILLYNRIIPFLRAMFVPLKQYSYSSNIDIIELTLRMFRDITIIPITAKLNEIINPFSSQSDTNSQYSDYIHKLHRILHMYTILDVLVSDKKPEIETILYKLRTTIRFKSEYHTSKSS